MSKRRTRFSALPETHAKIAETAARRLETTINQAQRAVASRDCATALTRLNAAHRGLGAASYESSHADTSDRGRLGRRLETLGEDLQKTEGQFRKACMRKPSLIDRIRGRR